jgi:hypothetical protein
MTNAANEVECNVDGTRIGRVTRSTRMQAANPTLISGETPCQSC